MTESEQRRATPDPMEQIIENALERSGYDYTREGDSGQRLDFYVPALRCYIEVKQFHSDRIGGQMASAPNIIVAQGRAAVEALATLIADRGIMARELREMTDALVQAREQQP